MTQVIDQTGFIENVFGDVSITSLTDYVGGNALLLQNNDDPTTAAPFFETLDLIIVPFPSSADGRGFSIARDLRALGYRGHLRARGHILVDQFRAALRCGFDDIEIEDKQSQRNPEDQWKMVSQNAGYQTRLMPNGPCI